VSRGTETNDLRSPVCPTVVALRQEFDDEQTTTFQIQDLRAEPPLD
jgi:hypothetical protein